MNDPILDKLLELARKRFGEKATTLQPGDDLYEALAIDSMQAMDLLTTIEDAFSVEIPDYELAEVRTLASIADIVRRRQ
jgi:acyl carrier protein